MGFRFSILLMPLLLTSPALAQQNEGASPVFNLPQGNVTQPAPTRQQGPEIDVYRAPATPLVAPPVVLPTVDATPVPATPVDSKPPQAAARPERPSRAATAPVAPSEQAARPLVDRPPATPAPEAPAVAPPPHAPMVVAPTNTPAPASSADAGPTQSTPWGWIAGAVMALIAAVLLLRHRRADAVAEIEVEPSPPVADETDTAIITPPTAPEQVEEPVTEPAASEEERPRLDCSLEVTAARYSLMGATIAYRLAVHNRSDRAAEDILIRVLLANAGTAQQDTLDRFLDGSLGLACHSIVMIAPGEGQWLSGELRLPPEEIVPLQAGERALLVPLALFDLHYPLPDGGTGRLARSFLIGQAPASADARLAPLRMDMGPRQFRNPAARAVGDILVR